MIQVLVKNPVSCGNLSNIPGKIPELTSDIFLLIQIAVPVVLVIMGMIDLFKAITASKEDEMTKARSLFVKRLIIGALVFFIFAIVKLLIGFINSKTTTNNLTDCMECFLNNGCNKVENTWQCRTAFVYKEPSSLSVSYDLILEYKTYSGLTEIYNAPTGEKLEYTMVNNDFAPNKEGDCPISSAYNLLYVDTYDEAHDKFTYEFWINKK